MRMSGWIVDGWRSIGCRWTNDAWRMEIEDFGVVRIHADGTELSWIRRAPGLDDQRAEAALSGPPAMFALALRGGLSLHASAIRVGDELVAFLGESGAGKSTLARAVAAEVREATQVADDILPLRADLDGRLVGHGAEDPITGVGLPVRPATEVPFRTPEEPLAGAPLKRVYVLQPVDLEQDSASNRAEDRLPEVRRSRGAEAVTALVRHTALTALYGKEMHRRHFQICASAASHVSVARLLQPHTPWATRRTLERLSADMRSKA